MIHLLFQFLHELFLRQEQGALTYQDQGGLVYYLPS
mgnify:CR=1 FL=1